MINVGIVGVGCISGIYLKNIKETFKEIEIIGVCDLVREKAEKATYERLVQALFQSYKTKHPDMSDDVVRDHIIEDIKAHKLDNEIKTKGATIVE